jgi:3-isopropylmalate/(R)-2-methylmalate dehydratase small subunit
VDKRIHTDLFALVAADYLAQVSIDLEEQVLVLPEGSTINFVIDRFSRYCLLEGVDQLGYLLNHDAQITNYEKTRGYV